MKKVLILAYFYPPSVFVGGQRVEYWAKNLHQFGYFPVIVTRNWNDRQITLTEEVIDNELKIEKYDTHEIHRVPYNRSLRDKLADNPKMKFFQKTLTLWEMIASNFSTKALPYRNMLTYCERLIRGSDFEVFIASGRPFHTFHMGHKLKKKYDIQWVPDFRDEWNSHYRTPFRNPLMKIIAALERRSEKKWVSNADLFLSVSDVWVNRISKFNGIQGAVVKNGYDAIIPKLQREDKDLKILYAGTLYPYQDISTVTEAVLKLNNPNIKFFFIGSCESAKMRAYLLDLEQKNSQLFKVIGKIPKEEFETVIGQMDIGVMSPYKNLTGCLPVKIFDYYAHGLELLLCPSDEDLMVEFISNTQSGITVESQQDCEKYLLSKLKEKTEGTFDNARDYNLGREYSRAYQTEILAKTLDSIVNK